MPQMPRFTRDRATIAEGPDGLRIVIPSWRGRAIGLLFFGAWIVAWNALWLGARFRLLKVEDAQVADGWQGALIELISNAVCVPMFLWHLAGRQVILIDDRALTIRHELFGVGPSRSYVLAGIGDLRASDEGLEAGSSVAFDHDGVRRRFARELPAAEVERLIAAIRGRFAIPDGQRTDHA